MIKLIDNAPTQFTDRPTCDMNKSQGAYILVASNEDLVDNVAEGRLGTTYHPQTRSEIVFNTTV